MLSGFEEQILERKDLFYKRLTCNTEETGNLKKRGPKSPKKACYLYGRRMFLRS